ncbi:hypothetical protein N7462_001582 [Penicillium macrosclerotiorum]|uniref:uncharacterized protein n=1 Tax=Penicillium macrosclerotiorum TaxID=303699 RepID=UPI0025475914|nr:uncharacterized protein N7462_001582 [Penicillium macrosclerotiorum]KAJ5692159.1 hypothetical protein N7462_001582 [Penicillium macrosclerotiorum]
MPYIPWLRIPALAMQSHPISNLSPPAHVVQSRPYPQAQRPHEPTNHGRPISTRPTHPPIGGLGIKVQQRNRASHILRLDHLHERIGRFERRKRISVQESHRKLLLNSGPNVMDGCVAPV